jgi:hypothetical protein
MKRRALLAAVGALPTAGCVRRVPIAGKPSGVDASGDIEVRIDGERFDLSADRFQAEHAENDSLAFHLREDAAGDDRWYMEGEKRVTVAEGIDLLPHFAYEDAGDGDVLTVDGRSYDEREGADG